MNDSKIKLDENFQVKQSKEKIEEVRKNFVVWVKAHKKQLFLAGIGVTTVISIIIGGKNIDSFKKLWLSLEENIQNISVETSRNLSKTSDAISTLNRVESTRIYTLPKDAVDVKSHIRTMAVGKHHSVEKAEEAAKLGIKLLPNQTLVNSYSKYVA